MKSSVSSAMPLCRSVLHVHRPRAMELDTHGRKPEAKIISLPLEPNFLRYFVAVTAD